MAFPKRHHRINQRSKLPKGVKFVGRPSRYGNRHQITDEMPRKIAVLRYKEELMIKLAVHPHFLEPLRGKDLACYCELSEECHADILIVLANRPRRVT